MAATQARVAQHYGQVRVLSRHDRDASPTAGLRTFHNWIKAALLQRYAVPGGAALDLCCGKGGDLLKWKAAGVAEVYMVDIARGAVEAARARAAQIRGPATWFHVADCFRDDLAAVLPPTPVEVVSCQFSLHYACDSAATLRGLLRNATARLRVGGVLVATFLDGDAVRARFPTGTSNSVFRLDVDARTARSGGFGRQCTFSLEGSVDAVPEYLVARADLCTVAAELGLHCIQWVPFAALDREMAAQADMAELRRAMRVDAHPMSDNERTVSDLYVAAVFCLLPHPDAAPPQDGAEQ